LCVIIVALINLHLFNKKRGDTNLLFFVLLLVTKRKSIA
jgi:hypothetical protein